MQFVYKPEGADPKAWEFRPEKLMSPEAEAIERLTKMTFGEWTRAVRGGSMLALHGLLYVMLKREYPTLKWDEVQFSLSEVDFELTDEETAELRTELEAKDAAGELNADEREFLEQLRAETPEPPEAVEDQGTDPKD